jgi:hypothetical protein
MAAVGREAQTDPRGIMTSQLTAQTMIGHVPANRQRMN